MSVRSPNLEARPCSGAHALLMDLCRPFVKPGFVVDGDLVEPDDIPHPDDSLLVHHDHMTVTLERHFGAAVAVHVKRESREGDTYTRLIELTAGPRRVEWGIARLNLRLISPAVRDEILEKRSPLGAILVRHDVHRRVKPRHFLRFAPGSRVLTLFDPVGNAAPIYGRLGTIYCDDEPAIELLETVLTVDR